MSTAIIRTAKENHLKSKLNQEYGDAKKTWKTINNVIGKKSAKLPSSISFHGKLISTNREIVEKFNNYFTSADSKLVSDIQAAKVPLDFSFYQILYHSHFFFSQVQNRKYRSYST